MISSQIIRERACDVQCGADKCRVLLGKLEETSCLEKYKGELKSNVCKEKLGTSPQNVLISIRRHIQEDGNETNNSVTSNHYAKPHIKNGSEPQKLNASCNKQKQH
jgi:hypothetical protein